MNIAQCRQTLDQRLATRRAAHRVLWEQARCDAERIVQHIVTHYRPRRIVLWGSLLHSERFNATSDIDVAIEGRLEPEAWFRLLGEAWAMTDFSVDLVDLGHIEPEFAAIILMKGKVVYERDPNSGRGNP